MNAKHKPLLGFIDEWHIAEAFQPLVIDGDKYWNYVIGRFRDHPTFAGRFGHTSAIIKRDGNNVETLNSRYILGTPKDFTNT